MARIAGFGIGSTLPDVRMGERELDLRQAALREAAKRRRAEIGMQIARLPIETGLGVYDIAGRQGREAGEQRLKAEDLRLQAERNQIERMKAEAETKWGSPAVRDLRKTLAATQVGQIGEAYSPYKMDPRLARAGIAPGRLEELTGRLQSGGAEAVLGGNLGTIPGTATGRLGLLTEPQDVQDLARAEAIRQLDEAFRSTTGGVESFPGTEQLSPEDMAYWYMKLAEQEYHPEFRRQLAAELAEPYFARGKPLPSVTVPQALQESRGLSEDMPLGGTGYTGTSAVPVKTYTSPERRKTAQLQATIMEAIRRRLFQPQGFVGPLPQELPAMSPETWRLLEQARKLQY